MENKQVKLSSKYPVMGLLTIMLLGIGACGSMDKDEKEDRSLTQRKSPVKQVSTADRLYRAIMIETKSRGWEVETASQKHYIVSTTYETINPRFRKRRIMRVLVLPRGGALRIKVEYERNTGTGEVPEWVEVFDDVTQARARKEELLLGRAIEKRFQRMRR